jgi:hypothetical protein
MFLACQAGPASGAKYVKKVNGKLFSYIGDSYFGSFIEEFLYILVGKYSAEFQKEKIVSVVVTDSSVYLIYLNDSDVHNYGKSTIEYSRNDFSDNEIMGFLNDHIEDRDKLLFVEIKDGIVSMNRTYDSIQFTISQEEINPEEMISGVRKIKKFIANTYKMAIAIVIMIVTPLVFIFYFNKIMDSYRNDIESIKIEISKNNLLLNKANSEKSMAIGNRVENVDSLNDIFNNVELMTRLLDSEPINNPMIRHDQMKTMPGQMKPMPGQMNPMPGQMNQAPGQMNQAPGQMNPSSSPINNQ